MPTGTYEEFLAALRLKESSGNYQARNQFGAVGAYQFHEAALKQIGWYSDNTPASNPGDDWIGSFTAQSGVSTLQQFLNSPTSQDNAMKAWAAEIWRVASSDPYNATDHIGETFAGTVLTATGILGGSHLWGTNNLDRYLDSNGSYNPADPFGTRISDYVRLFSGYDSPFGAGTTPPVPDPDPDPTPPQEYPSPAIDTISVRVSGDRDPNFAIYVDGRLIDATNRVTADHGDGEWQTVTVNGDFDPTGVQAHLVGIAYTNDARGRNLYVDSVTFNGVKHDFDSTFRTNDMRTWDFLL